MTLAEKAIQGGFTGQGDISEAYDRMVGEKSNSNKYWSATEMTSTQTKEQKEISNILKSSVDEWGIDDDGTFWTVYVPKNNEFELTSSELKSLSKLKNLKTITFGSDPHEITVVFTK